MCAICEGADPDTVLAIMRGEVDDQGWTFVGVGPSHRSPGWIYSVGLTVNFDHPELVMVGAPREHANHALGHIAEDVSTGSRFRPLGSYPWGGGLRLRFDWVHPRHFRLGTFALWDQILEGRVGGVHPRALQVLPPEELMRTPRRWRLTHPDPIG